MSGMRLVVGAIFMGVLLPVSLFLLLNLQNWSQLITMSVATFFAWGVVDLLASILERPRLQNRSPQDAFHDWEQGKQQVAGPKQREE